MFSSKMAAVTESSGFYSMVQVFILILLAFVFLLLLLLLGIYISTVIRLKQKNILKKSVEEAVKKAMSVKSDKQAGEILYAQKVFNRRGFAVLAEVFEEMDSGNKRKLRKILLAMDIGKNLAQQLDSDNEDYLVELIRLANDVGLAELDNEIAHVMMQYKENINIQYEALYALMRFGSFDNIIRICKDKDYKQTLSFRSLQEIIDAYSGDKPALYKELLGSPDAYITRICIMRIGHELVRSLAPDVEIFLESDNINLVMDAMRALGMLGYKQAVPEIVKLLKHGRWEVRSIAVNTLATLDLVANIDRFVTMLQDSEWQVRYNAGLALSEIKDIGDIRGKVAATGDKYALDMFEYMADLAEMRRAER